VARPPGDVDARGRTDHHANRSAAVVQVDGDAAAQRCLPADDAAVQLDELALVRLTDAAGGHRGGGRLGPRTDDGHVRVVGADGALTEALVDVSLDGQSESTGERT